MKRIAIIGAGRFGMSLAEALLESGVEVLLVDRNGALTQQAADLVTQSVQGDATLMNTLKAAGVPECHAIVVAIGSNLEASMLVTANCRELCPDAEVIAKATSDIHGKILEKLGADRVVYPDRDSARRLADAISEHDGLDLLQVAEGISVAEIDIPEDCIGKTLVDLDLRRKSGVTVLCLRRVAENPRKPRTVVLPNPADPLRAGDRMLIMGTAKAIDKFHLRDR